MSSLETRFGKILQALDDQAIRRVLRPVRPLPGGRLERDGRVLVDFSSNDYLGLRRHPALIERAREWTALWGTGSGASRLITGTLAPFERIEAKLASLKRTEAALLFTSGFQANAGLLPALLDRRLHDHAPQVLADRLNHASLHQGLAAAGVRQKRYRHNDLDHLEQLLKVAVDRPGARFIVTESVFSMDGDQADVPALAALAEQYDAFLILDEAHATGVLGPGGGGLSPTAAGRVSLVMGTFSKALGSFGAYVAGSRKLCDYLVNRCAAFIYTTALPPAVLGAMEAALDLLATPEMAEARARVLASAETVRRALTAAGVANGASTTPIVPALLGSARAAMEAAELLETHGLLGMAIRPPTVPKGTARLRLALSAVHDAADVARLADLAPALAERVDRSEEALS